MSTLPPEVQELLAELQSNPTHDELGMVQEFVVTAAGTESGPLPASDADEVVPEDEESASA